MSIAENIKHLRESREMTQIQFAELFGVSDKTVSTWEIGTRTPRMGVIQKIADYYHITKSDIIEGDLLNINNENIELSAREETLVANYRQLNEDGKDKADEYIEDLLGMKRVYRAARSANNHPAEITVLTKEEQERIEKAPRVTSENSDL